jgi:hypothetical protein
MPEELWRRVKARAVVEGVSTNQLMVRLLDGALPPSSTPESVARDFAGARAIQRQWDAALGRWEE